MSYDLGGFSVTASTSRVMLIIFAVYSVVIVGFGFYIKYQSKKGGKDGLASFLTGGGAGGCPRFPACLADLSGAVGGCQLCHAERTGQAGIFPGVLL